MWGDGQGYVPDELLDAPTTIVGQNPGEDEEKVGRPFVGKTGQMIETRFFARAGLVRGENVSLCNVVKCRWLVPDKKGTRLVDGERYKATNQLPPPKVLNAAVKQCVAAHLRIPPQTALIVAQGALAWRALGNTTPITAWRGYLSPKEYQL